METSSLLEAAADLHHDTPQLFPDLSQAHLIEQLQHFILLEGRDESVFDEAGLCFGFSVIHAYMQAVRAGDWYYEVLRLIALWDGSSPALDEVILLEYGRVETRTTLRRLMAQLVGYSIYYHCAGEQNLGFDWRVSDSQLDVLVPDSPFFFSADGLEIAEFSVIGGHFTRTMLRNLLMEDLYAQSGIFLILVEDHAMSLRYDPALSRWCFYDPNKKHGEKIFNRQADLIGYIVKKYGNDLQLASTTWVGDELAQALQAKQRARYQSMCRERLPTLLKGDGWIRMCHYDADKNVTFVLSGINADNVDALIRAVEDASASILKCIQAPRGDAACALFNCAKQNPVLSNIIAKTICVGLDLEINLITKMMLAPSADKVLLAFFDLLEAEEARYQHSQAGKFFDANNSTLLQAFTKALKRGAAENIATLQPMTVECFFDLADRYPCVKQKLSQWHLDIERDPTLRASMLASAVVFNRGT